MATTSFSLNGSHIKFAIPQIKGSYDGTLSADGTTITGTFTQGLSLPLEFRHATKETAWADPSPHSAQFIPVEKNVKLEVLDWGGFGKPLVLLAGLGNSAHIFDNFAPKLTATYHVRTALRGADSALQVLLRPLLHPRGTRRIRPIEPARAGRPLAWR